MYIARIHVHMNNFFYGCAQTENELYKFVYISPKWHNIVCISLRTAHALCVMLHGCEWEWKKRVNARTFVGINRQTQTTKHKREFILYKKNRRILFRARLLYDCSLVFIQAWRMNKMKAAGIKRSARVREKRDQSKLWTRFSVKYVCEKYAMDNSRAQ